MGVTARLALAGVLVVNSPSGVLAQPTTVGDEFLVNTYTTGPQRFASVCTLDESDFVVAWEDGRSNYFGLNHSVDGSETAVVARRLGGEPPSGDFDFLVNAYTTGRQGQPSTACLDDGGFVVVWSEGETYFNPPPQGRFGVLGRRYDDAGQPVGSEFPLQVMDDDPGFSDPPDEGSVCRGPDGGFVVAWNVYEQTTVRRYDAAGTAPAADVDLPQLNNPKCCGSDDGFVVVGWQGSFATGTPEVFAQRFSATGALAGTQFTVNTYTTGRQASPAVGCKADGAFLVVWESSPSGPDVAQDGDGVGVFGQRFEVDGNPLGSEFQVNDITTNDQIQPSAAMDAAGHFVVVWTDYAYDDVLEVSTENVFARAFDQAGVADGGGFQVNTYTTEPSSNPSVAIGTGGAVVVAWHTSNDGDDHSISAQRYSLGAAATTTTTTLPPMAGCGDPVALQASKIGARMTSDAVTASDALFTLQAAVGVSTCAACVCDVDGSGSVAATDALAILKYAVGQPIPLDCPSC